MNGPHDEFDQIVKKFHMSNPSEISGHTPYGGPVQAPKTGLTKRGKVALGIGAAVISGSVLIGYQVHAANVAESEAKAQEIAFKTQALKLEEIRELNRSAEANRKAVNRQATARQASIDACVKDNADQVGKTYGAPSRRDIVSDCQAQYPSSTSSGNMTATASQTTNDSSGGGVNQGLLIGGGVLAVVLVAAAKKGTHHPA